MTTPRFLIVATGYNCGKYVKPCYDSVMAQARDDAKLIMISDGSTDHTSFELKMCDEATTISYQSNEGAAKRRYEAIRQYAQEQTIVVLMGMDDELLPGALDRIEEEYRRGKWMTYGNWIDQWGDMNAVGLHFPDDVHRDRSYRKVSYRSTAPNTFYRFLFDQIPEDDFKINGKWVDTTTESELMFSCLEMCGKNRIGIIEEPIYLYNRLLTNGTQKRLGQKYKNEIYARVTARPKRNLFKGTNYEIDKL